MFNPDWFIDAACAGCPEPEVFHPDKMRPDLTADAIELCKACPVREPCLRAALDAEAGDSWKSRHGIWGGFTPKQRWRMDGGAKELDIAAEKHGTTQGAYLHHLHDTPICEPCRVARNARNRENHAARKASEDAAGAA